MGYIRVKISNCSGQRPELAGVGEKMKNFDQLLNTIAFALSEEMLYLEIPESEALLSANLDLLFHFFIYCFISVKWSLLWLLILTFLQTFRTFQIITENRTGIRCIFTLSLIAWAFNWHLSKVSVDIQNIILRISKHYNGITTIYIRLDVKYL